jgi:hypothetical protein
MGNIKKFNEHLSDNTFTAKQVLSMIVDTAMMCMGDEWIPQEDDEFKSFLKGYNLLDLFEVEYDLNESNDFILNNDTVKTHTWTSKGKEYNIKYHLGYDVFTGLYTANLLGGEFHNTYGQGETEEDAVKSLKLRLIQLRNK